MGRPLNKKYFGNRNIGSISTITDNGIGGEGLATVATGTAGSGYSTGVTLTVAAPTLPGGVTALVSVAVSARVANGTGGVVTGYTVTERGSGYRTAPSVTVVKPATVTGTFSGVSGTKVLTTTGSTAGIFPGMTVTGDTGLGTGTAANSVVVDTVDSATQVTVLTNNDGTITSATLSFADSGASAVPGTRTLTTDSGNVGTVTNQENAIVCFAKTTSGGTRIIGDIIKQVSTNRYKVKTANGTAVCQLVTDGSTGYLKMDITAYDTAEDPGVAGEYWVAKLTSRVVTLVAKDDNSTIGGTDFTNGTKVKWGFGTAVAPSGSDYGTAKIQNS